MIRIFFMALLGLSLATASLAETVHCTTREEPAFKRWVTTCTDGARSALQEMREPGLPRL